MSITINDIVSSPIDLRIDPAAGPSSSAGADRSANTTDPSPAALHDQTSFSSLGGLLTATVNDAAARSSFRPAIVAQFKNAIASGAYQPNPDAVAARITQALKGGGT